MRKTICTASIFAGFVAVMIASWMIHTQNFHPWWIPEDTKVVDAPVFVWFFVQAFLPLMVLFCVAFIGVGLWSVASWCCAKLRGNG